MRFDAATRTRVLADMTLDFDPAGSTPEVKVDAVWYPATWQGTAAERTTLVNGVPLTKWTQTARTTGYFAGPNAVAAGATVLALGRHLTQTRVTSGGDILVAPSSPIDVK